MQLIEQNWAYIIAKSDYRNKYRFSKEIKNAIEIKGYYFKKKDQITLLKQPAVVYNAR